MNIEKTDEEFLPSLNMRFKLRDDLFLRFAASETVVRPDFDDLNPATTLTAPGPTLPGQGTGGNPDLENQKAMNGDLSLEWYFGAGGLLSGGIFYRDIETTCRSSLPRKSLRAQEFEVSRPRGTDATLKGFGSRLHAVLRHVAGFWSGFGTQINYTWWIRMRKHRICDGSDWADFPRCRCNECVR